MEIITQRPSSIENRKCLSARVLTDSQFPSLARITIGTAFLRQDLSPGPLQADRRFLVLFLEHFCGLLPLSSLDHALEWKVTRPHWLNVAIQLKYVPLDVMLACSTERIYSL